MECPIKWNTAWLIKMLDFDFYPIIYHPTQNGMLLKMILLLKMESHLKWNVTQNGISLKSEFHLKWNVTHNGMLLKMKYHSNWNVTQIGMSFKFKCHSNWNVTQRMSLKLFFFNVFIQGSSCYS